MLYWLLCLLLTVFSSPATGQRRSGVAAGTNPLGLSEAVIEAGRLMYNRSCTACHGLDGDVGDRAPALKGTRRFARSSDDELFEAIRHGIKGTMMPSSPLPDDDVWRIVAYIRSMRASAYEAPVEGNVEKGREVFWGTAKCGGCHMIQGRGGLIGPDLSDVGGERSVQKLKEALTVPRPHVPARYRPAKVVTRSGETVEGIIKNEHNFSLQMIDRQQRIRLFTSDEIQGIEYGATTLMPTDWDKRLKPDEFKDLIAFLSRQAAARLKELPETQEENRR
ncbi:MAG: c-type cytochrome [Bryobacteraceae bacterium]